MSEINRPRALVVERDEERNREMAIFLENELDCEVTRVRDGEAAYNVLDHEPVHVLITELRAQRIDGLRLLEIARARYEDVAVILTAPDAELATATEAMRDGAYDLQTRPIDYGRLKAVLERALSHQRLVLEVSDLQARLDHRYGIRYLTGMSPQMVAVYDRIRQLADTKTTILITGETGTGKELVAKAIHHLSPRRNEPFVALNCSALAEGVVESELFGHERGAFTGATASRRGRFEIADGGTLFLDEISEVSPAIQVKLLRVIQEREVERVGAAKPIPVDVRLICATNRDLEALVRDGTFRQDLYYRLNVASIKLPPLRERRSDIPLLVDEFIEEFNRESRRKVKGITRGAMELLMQHPWPGNVRELRNLIEGMVVFGREGEPLDVSDLPNHLRDQVHPSRDLRLRVGMTMEEIEKRAIEETLKATGYDKQRAAQILGIGLRSLYRKVKQYEIGR
jgi:DNA-binding NtrC family response regulator